MLGELIVSPRLDSNDESAVRRAVEREFPRVQVTFDDSRRASSHIVRTDGSIAIPALRWLQPDFDPREFDDPAVESTKRAPPSLTIVASGARASAVPLVALQALTRCQRFLGRHNEHSASALFERILERHRSLHDLARPLVAADYAHALDTWQWALRLSPGAALPIQVAALFHDIERLASESNERIEHRAADYLSFKRAHAAHGARMTRDVLSEAGAEPELVDTVARLVSGHEQPGDDVETVLLNEADALSFLSLNASGFLDYYGEPHTQRKVRFTLARLGPRGLRVLRTVRYRAEIATLIEAALGQPASVAPELRTERRRAAGSRAVEGRR